MRRRAVPDEGSFPPEAFPADLWPDGKRHMREEPPEPDADRGFLVSGLHRVRSGNASGIPATHEAAGAEADNAAFRAAPYGQPACRGALSGQGKKILRFRSG